MGREVIDGQLVLPFLSLISDAELHRNPAVKAETGHEIRKRRNFSPDDWRIGSFVTRPLLANLPCL